MSFIKKAAILLFFLALPALVWPQDAARRAEWAQPVAGTGLGNLYRLDAKLYRSGQPGRKEFAKLEGLGVRTVINLRSCYSDDCAAGETSLRLYHVKMRASRITREDLVRVLKIIKSEQGPLLVHCRRGADRTGAVCAAYRVVFQGWSKEAAIDEMINGGYGFYRPFASIPELIRGLDVAAVRSEIER